MSIHDVCESPGFKTGDYTVTRYAATTINADGLVVPGATSTFTAAGSLQPYRGREIIVGPEGQTNEDIMSLRTNTELRATPGTPDEVTHEGVQWKVFRVESWTGLGGTSYRAYIARQKVGA